MKRDLKSLCLNSIKTSHCQLPLFKHFDLLDLMVSPANTEQFSPCFFNVGLASKKVGNIETTLNECLTLAGRANVWRTDSVMTAITGNNPRLVKPN